MLFKIGDVVERTRGEYYDMSPGDIGTVTKINDDLGIMLKEFPSRGYHSQSNFKLYKVRNKNDVKYSI